MNNKLQLQEIKRWLKTSLKNKVSINSKTIITYLMLGLVGVGTIVEAAWSNQPVRIDGENNKKKMTVLEATQNVTGRGSVIFADHEKINNTDEHGNKKNPLTNSVIIGFGDLDARGQSMEIDVKKEPETVRNGIVAIGAVKVSYNPFGAGDGLGKGSQAVAIGNDVASTSQAVAIGNNTYALGSSSIAIGNDDNNEYRDKITDYDYDEYLKALYNKIDSGKVAYGTGSAPNAIFSPNVAGGQGSIAIGSRTLAYKNGSTAIGTLAFALGKGATALGTQSRAEGEGAIAIGNKTRNFADQALAIGNDSQIRYKGGTAIGLKARSAGEGAIAIGTEIYANASINNSIRNVKNKNINEIENYLNNLNANTVKHHDIDGIVKNTNDGTTNLAKNAIAIGTKSAAVGDNSIVLGRGSFAFAKNSFALGSYSYAESENGAAIGVGAKSISYENSDNRNNDNYMHNGKNAMAIGNGALATLENSISIGVNSKTDYSYNELLKPGWLPNGATSIPSSGKTGVISVGSKGYERRIINVAPGYRGTDAVNVDQLKSFENRLENKQYDSGFTMQYISVEKNKGKAKEISDKLKLNSEYIEYIDLREQLELIKARHKFKDEEIVAETKTTIETRIAELERNPLIKTTAGAMGTYTSDSLPTGTSEQDKEDNFKAFYNTLEAKKKEALKEETKKPLFGNKLLKDVLANTNYNNDGATGKDAMAFGYRTEASGEASIAIGAPSNPAGSTSNDVITKATGLRGIAIGAGAVNTEEYSVALGSNSKVTGKEGIAIGDRAEATLEKSVAIGSGSTVTATTDKGYLTDQSAPDKSGMVVSVGGRRIQKLKDGAADDDAVTVAQLKKLKEQTLTRDDAKITIAPDENGTQEFTIGSTINLKTNDAWGSGDGRFVGDNIETYKKADGTILIGVKENPKFKTISLNNKENNAIDLTLSSDKNGNLSLGNKKIINVGEGSITSNSTDVVIGKQLKATEDKIETLKVNALTKTEASTTYVTKTEAGNLKLKYAANKDAAKEVFLSSGLKFKDGTNTKAEVEDNGVVRFNLNKDLTGITSITSGENKAKLTFGDNITVNSKKITGLTDATLSDSSTDAVTGKQLKSTEDKVTTLNTKVETITNNITTLTSGGIKFKGNDNGEVTTALGSKLNLVGEGVESTDTFNSASGNIKVEKGTSTDTLTFKLSKDLKNIKSIELKDGDKTSTLTINNEGDVTIGGNEVVTTNNIGSQSIGYKANGTGDKTTTLTTGFNFLNGTNTIAEISDNGGVKFNLNSSLTGITSITSGDNKAKLTLGDDDISLNDKKLTGVTNGLLSKTSKDAINGSQLYDVLSKIELIDKSGNIVKPKINDITSKDGNTTKSETIVGGINNIINTLNNGITFAGVEGSSKQYLGSTLTIKNGDITNNNIKFKGENLITKYTNNAGDGTLTIGLKESPTFKEVTISDKATINGKEVATKDDLSNVNSAITLNLTKDGTTNHGSVNLKDQKLKVTGEDGLDVEISGQDITVKLGSEFKKKVDKIINNPTDGKDGKNGTEANSEGSKGATGKDGLNGKDLTDKVNALRNGTAGSVIFTNENGERLYKGNDGKYYLKEQLNDNGTPKTGFENQGIANPELRLVNADGTTTKATTLNNLANGLAGITRDTDKPITPEKAKEVITALLTQTTGLDKAVNVGDLQALAQAGLYFTGNDNTVSLHRALGRALQISGERNTDETFESASDNINVKVLEDATKNISKLEIQLAKALKNIESIQNGDTKITLDKDKSNVEIATGDKAKTTINEDGIKVIGKDGKDAVSINGTDGTNGASVIVKGKDGADGVTIKGGNGTDAPSIDFAKKTENGNTTGTGTITGLKDPDGNDKTAATTVNYVTNEITKATTSLTDKGLKFVGNDGNEVTKKLGETLSIKGEGVSSSDTFNSASGNIKVSKGTDGLEIGLSKNIKNIETIELKGKDGVNGTIGIDKGELTLTKDSKTTKILTEANIGDQKIKYKANDGTSKEVKLSDGFNFTNGENTTAEVGDNGVVKVNVNSKLNNIESIAAKDSTKGIEITNGDKAKTTINEEGIKVIGKDGKDAVTVNGTDGTNGASVIVKGKDGADGVTIKGGNGTDAPSIDFAKKTENGNTTGTGTITGLKDPDGNDKTAATTVNYVTNEITKATTSLTDKGLKFVGNDGNEVTKKLGETLSIKGEGVSSSDTFNSASGNIKVSKGTDGLEIGLSKNIKNIETIELKGKDGVNGTIGIDKGELTLTKDSKTTKILTEANIGDQKIKYKANDGTSKEVKLSDGFNFTNGENTTAEIGDNGVVKVSVNSTLNKMKAINFENGKITGLATPDGKDVTSAANVAYVDKKVSNVEHLSNKALSGVANAIAMANLPQITANSEYNTSIGASYGTYNGENSLALGVSGVNNKANFLYRASASLNTKGNVAFGIGLGYQFGKKKDVLENSKLSKLELKLNTLKEENETNKSKVSELEVIIKEISKENDKLRKEINEKDIQNEYRVIRLEEQNIEMKNYLEKLILENQKNKEILEKLLKNSESK